MSTNEKRQGAARVSRRLGPYELLESIGSGGSGLVFRAVQQSPLRYVALKVLGIASHSETVESRFERESKLLARLDHPSLPGLLDSGTAQTDLGPVSYLAMELVEGTNLIQYVNDAGLGLRERAALMARICDGVQHAHQRGVLHRDLKPANVRVDGDGQPWILDFGIARLMDGDEGATLEGDVIGTPGYMSPEQREGRIRDVDTRTDVFALGVMIREILLEDLDSARGALARDIQFIVRRATRRQADARYQSVSELGEDLRRALRREPVVARSPVLTYEIHRLVARRPRVMTGAVLAIVLAIGMGWLSSAVRSSELFEFRESVRSYRRTVANDFAVKLCEYGDAEFFERFAHVEDWDWSWAAVAVIGDEAFARAFRQESEYTQAFAERAVVFLSATLERAREHEHDPEFLVTRSDVLRQVQVLADAFVFVGDSAKAIELIEQEFARVRYEPREEIRFSPAERQRLVRLLYARGRGQAARGLLEEAEADLLMALAWQARWRPESTDRIDTLEALSRVHELWGNLDLAIEYQSDACLRREEKWLNNENPGDENSLRRASERLSELRSLRG